MHCLDRGKLDSTFTFVADLTEPSNRHLIIKYQTIKHWFASFTERFQPVFSCKILHVKNQFTKNGLQKIYSLQKITL